MLPLTRPRIMPWMFDQRAGFRDTMMSESDSTSGRRPPTIELKATEVEQPKAPPDTAAAEPTKSTPAPEISAPEPSAKSEVRLFAHAVSAAIGAIAAAAVLVGLWLAGFTLARDVVTEATAPIIDTGTNGLNPAVAARLDKIERAIQAPKPEAAATIPPELGNRITAVEMQAKMLGDSVAALHHRTDDIAATAQAAQKQAATAASTADAAKNAGQTGVQKSDMDALASRIAALESAVKALSEQVAHPTTGADQAARLTIAAEALRAAVERGAPYQAELKAVRALGADQSATAPLEPFAANGVPEPDALAHDLATLVPALRKAADTSSGETGFLGKLKASAQNLVEFTPADAPPGDDPSSVITRLTIDADRADIAAALTDSTALPDALKPLAAHWVKTAQARDAAIAASRSISAQALAAFSKPAAQ
jgi:hypothetical protein